MKYIIFLVLSATLQAQKIPVNFIRFDYSMSNVVGLNVSIFIERGYSKDNVSTLTISNSVKFTDETKTLKISNVYFDEIVDYFFKIDPRVLSNTFDSGLDGSNVKIEIGQLFTSSIEYNFNNYSYDYKAIKETIQVILKNAKVRIQDFK